MRGVQVLMVVLCLGAAGCDGTRSLSPEARVQVAQALFHAPATKWDHDWADGPRLWALRAEVLKLEERGAEARAELAAARERFVAEIAKHDRSYAEEMAALRAALEHFASTPEGLKALTLYNQHKQRKALAMLDDLRAEAAPAQSDRERAAAARHIAVLMHRADDASEFDTREVIARFEAVTRLDPDFHRDWIDLVNLYWQELDYRDFMLKAAETGLRLARTERERFLSLNALGAAYSQRKNRQEALKAWWKAWRILMRKTETGPNSVALGPDIRNVLFSISNSEDDEGKLAVTRQSFEAMKRMARANPTLQGPRKGMLSDLDDIRRILTNRKDLEEALDACRERVELLERLTETDPDEIGHPIDKADTLIDMADIYLMQRDETKARAALRESLAVLRALDESHGGVVGGSVFLQRKLASRWKQIGTLSAYREARDILKYIIPFAPSQDDLAGDVLGHFWGGVPSQTEIETDLQEILARIGEVLRRRGDMDGAVAAWRERLESSRRIAGANPRWALLQYHLAGNLNGFADRLRKLGRVKEAMPLYRESLEIQRRLADPYPEQSYHRRDLALGLLKFGDVLLEDGKPQEALALYRESLEIRKRFLETEPGAAFRQRDMAVNLHRIGAALEAGGDRNGALRACREALEIVRRLEKDADPSSSQARLDLIALHVKLARMTGDRSHIRKALDLALAMRERDALLPRDAWMIDDLRQRLKREGALRESKFEFPDLP